MSDIVAGSSTIHDLGYRRYTGPRVGESGAWSALFVQSLRAMFGLGRPMKSKVIPLLVVVVSTLPALAVITAAGASKGQVPVRYGQIIGGQLLLFVLFLASRRGRLTGHVAEHDASAG